MIKHIRMSHKPSGIIHNLFRGIRKLWSDAVQSGKERDLMTFLSEQFAVLEEQDTPVMNVYMNAKTYRKLRCTFPEQFDPVTRPELLRTGHMGDFWNAGIRIDKGLKDDEYVFSTEWVKLEGEGDDRRILSFTEWSENVA